MTTMRKTPDPRRSRRRPRVILNCPADRYSGPDKRIIEFSFPAKANGSGLPGGLIQLTNRDDGQRPKIEIYRTDGEVDVVGEDVVGEDRASQRRPMPAPHPVTPDRYTVDAGDWPIIINDGEQVFGQLRMKDSDAEEATDAAHDLVKALNAWTRLGGTLTPAPAAQPTQPKELHAAYIGTAGGGDSITLHTTLRDALLFCVTELRLAPVEEYDDTRSEREQDDTALEGLDEDELYALLENAQLGASDWAVCVVTLP